MGRDVDEKEWGEDDRDEEGQECGVVEVGGRGSCKDRTNS